MDDDLQEAGLTLDGFRERFPAFDADTYPDTAVAVRLQLAGAFFKRAHWPNPDVRAHVMGLYVAHYLTAQGSRAAGGEGAEGASLGVISSKSVDGASVSYDTGIAAESGAGFWNATPYGRELYQLLRVFGAGALQI